MEYRDYYKLLGVERRSSAETIKRAYRQLAMKFHPDLNPQDKQAEQKLKDINEAYAVLGEPRKRLRYDQLDEAYARWRQNGGNGIFNWEEWVKDHRPPPEAPRPSVEAPPKAASDPPTQPPPAPPSGGFSEFFNLIFENGAARDKLRATLRPVPRYQDYPIRITMEESYRGAERTLQVEGRNIKVRIPPGAQTGTRVRLAGAGPLGPGGKKIDLFLVVQTLEDERFSRKGDDLFIDHTLDLCTAVLGGEITLPTPGGNVLLTIPAGTQTGQVFRLAGRGMPNLQNPQDYGNLYVQVKVDIPRQLTPRQRSLFEKLKMEKTS